MDQLEKDALKARFQNGDNPLEGDFSALIDAIAEAAAREPSLEVSASDIRSMISTGSLKKGALYRIPFQTKHVIPNTSVVNTGTTEYLLLYALTSSSVSRFVYSENYPQDVIALDLTNVLCEDGTTPREGKITYRKDYDRNLETWYDFRNVRFRRWKVDAASNADIAWLQNTSYSVGSYVFVWDGFYTCTKEHLSGTSFEEDMWKLGYKADYSIFTGIQSSMYRMNIPVKGQEYQDFLTFWDDSANISIGAVASGEYNNIIFGQESQMSSIGENCRDMTFVRSVSNLIGRNCRDITMVYSEYNRIGDYSLSMYFDNASSNNIGSYVQYVFLQTAHTNIIESLVSYLTLYVALNCKVKNSCYQNEIYCRYAEIGTNSSYNKIGSASNYTKIGSNCSNNITFNSEGTELGDSSYNNVIKNSAYNMIGVSSNNNTISESSYNELGQGCSGNTFENSSNYNVLHDKCTGNSFDSSSNNTLKIESFNNTFSDGSNFNAVKGGLSVFTRSSDNKFEGNQAGFVDSLGNIVRGSRVGFYDASGNFADGIVDSDIRGTGNIIGSGCQFILLHGNNFRNIIGGNSTFITLEEGASYNEVGGNCYSITFATDSSTQDCKNNYVGAVCTDNIIRGTHIHLSTGCSGNEFAFGTSCVHFGVCVSNVKFVEAQNDLRFEVSGDIDKVFDGTYPNATVSKVSPDGSLWYETIDNSGVVTLHKLTEFVEEPEEPEDPEPTGPTLLQTIKIDLGTSATTSDTTWNYVTTNYTSLSPFPLNDINGVSSGCVLFPVSFAINGVTGASPDTGTGYSIPTDIMKSFFYVTAPNARNMTFKGSASRVYDIIIYGGKSTSGTTGPKVTIYTIGGVSKNLECYGNTANTVIFEKVVPDGTGQIVINVNADTTGGNTAGYINAVIVKEYSV